MTEPEIKEIELEEEFIFEIGPRYFIKQKENENEQREI